VAISS